MLTVRAFEFFSGVPRILVPDNLKSGVTKACYYEPDLNPSYAEMAAHYNTVVIPARVAKPRDKAKVEVGVQVAEQRILAKLRNRTFFGIDDLNRGIREMLTELNDRPFQKLDGSRRSVSESLERPALQPLPSDRYEFALWKKIRVNIDYHVLCEGNYYSVPYQMARQEVYARLTSTIVEVLFKGRRVASHKRLYGKGRSATLKEHMPASHRKYLEWLPSKLISWARGVGPNTEMTVETILESRPHPEQGFRSCLGIMRLAKSYPNDRIEAACGRAISIGAYTYQSIKSILARGLDQSGLEPPPPSVVIEHRNVRGADYYIQRDDVGC